MFEYQVINLMDYLGMDHDAAVSMMRRAMDTDQANETIWTKESVTPHQGRMKVHEIKVEKFAIDPILYRVTIS